MSLGKYDTTIDEIYLEPHRQQNLDAKLLPEELNAYRVNLGRMVYMSSILRPDIAAEVSIAATAMDHIQKVQGIDKDKKEERTAYR